MVRLCRTYYATIRNSKLGRSRLQWYIRQYVGLWRSLAALGHNYIDNVMAIFWRHLPGYECNPQTYKFLRRTYITTVLIKLSESVVCVWILFGFYYKFYFISKGETYSTKGCPPPPILNKWTRAWHNNNSANISYRSYR